MASFKQYRAPTANDQALVDPPWREQLDTLGNAAAPSSEARADLVRAALRYTRAYADVDHGVVDRLAEGSPLILSGHQPELYHPGVWFKNFALDALATRSRGIGVYLLIDSDLCRTPSVRVPTGSLQRPRLGVVPYDAPRAAAPYEQRPIADESVFRSFPQRLRETTAELAPEPLVGACWRPVNEALWESGNLGQAVAEMRHRLERAWGSQTLELPASVVCDQPAFRRFAADLLLRPREVVQAYNEALQEYRHAHGLRNEAQPLPDLQQEDPWCETPLWVWSDAAPRRRPLFARAADGLLVLSDLADWSAEGPCDADGVVTWLGDLRDRGVKIRGRALVTTWFARSVLSDLFLHGIGGAKYDQITDRLAERLRGQRPPAHATLTATLRLPVAGHGPTEAARRVAVKRLRDLRYHPETFLPDGEYAQQKLHWVRVAKTTENAAERHAAIQSANRAMASMLQADRARAEQELEKIDAHIRREALLGSREYPFCLFAEDDLRRRFEALLPPSL